MTDDAKIRRGDVVIARLDPAEGHETQKYGLPWCFRMMSETGTRTGDNQAYGRLS
jgi:hypothetical protein